MSLQTVRNFFSALNLDLPIIELETSTATVALAAEAHGVEPGRIAKTLAFRLSSGEALLLVARGDARDRHISGIACRLAGARAEADGGAGGCDAACRRNA